MYRLQKTEGRYSFALQTKLAILNTAKKFTTYVLPLASSQKESVFLLVSCKKESVFPLASCQKESRKLISLPELYKQQGKVDEGQFIGK